jgi:hypothetical protein
MNKIIKTKKSIMQNLANIIATTFLTIIGTGTAGAICFTFYTVFTM